jgi:sugar (pentulose or hexulose) kinase
VWFAGLDLGATFVKGAKLDVDAPALRQVVRRPFPAWPDGRGAARELDAELILDAARSVLDELLAEEGCAGIVLCGQMHGVVLGDAQGRACSPFVSWQDQRGLATAWPRVRAAVAEPRLDRWGHELRPGYPLVTLVRMGVTGDVTPAALPDWVAAALCGVRPVQEASNASGMGGWDLDAGRWDHEVFAELGVDELSWPEVVPHAAVVGEYRGVPVGVAVGDQQASLLGAFLEPGELSLNVATGSQAARIADRSERGAGQRRPYFGRALRTVTHIPAGRALNVLVDLVTELGGPEDPWPEISRRAAGVTGETPDVDLSFFASAFGDHGRITEITEELSVGTLFRGAFRGMAAHYAHAAELIGAGGCERIVFSGGIGRRTTLLRDAVAERIPLPQRTTRHDEDALAGLLVLAVERSGRASSLQEASAFVRAADDAGTLVAG